MRELLAIVMLSACTRDAGHVFTAASMQEPIGELAGKEMKLNIAASSVLARQIASGAPADLFISANREWVAWLSARVEVMEQKTIASNRLVLIARADDTRSFDELLEGRISLADPAHVPAGKYAQAALRSMGVQLESSIAVASDVRGALALVERGEVDAAVVYRTDALLSSQVRAVTEIESPLPIEYVAALLSERARPLYQRLSDVEGRRTLDRYGFVLP